MYTSLKSLRDIVRAILVSVLILPVSSVVWANISDPIKDWEKTFYAFKKGDVLWRWNAIVGNDKLIFLTLTDDYRTQKEEGTIPSWSRYNPFIGWSVYILTKRETTLLLRVKMMVKE